MPSSCAFATVANDEADDDKDETKVVPGRVGASPREERTREEKNEIAAPTRIIARK